jgi:hypothetical protein
MATRKIKLYGTNADVTTEATVLFDGVEVFSGVVDAVTDSALFGWDFTNADDTIESNHTLSIEVTAGSLSAGGCRISCGDDNISSWDNWNGVGTSAATAGMIEIAGDWYYQGGNNGYPYGDGSDTAQAERINCLVDGEVPGFLTEKTLDDQILPTGVLPDAPTFNGWYFRTDEGSTFTCTVRVPKQLPAHVAP